MDEVNLMNTENFVSTFVVLFILKGITIQVLQLALKVLCNMTFSKFIALSGLTLVYHLHTS